MADVIAKDVLAAAQQHMIDRESMYDTPGGERSIPATVAAFKAITGDGQIDSDERGWLFMVLLKLVRCQQGNFKLDNYEDGAAYCALMAESAAVERKELARDFFKNKPVPDGFPDTFPEEKTGPYQVAGPVEDIG